MGLIALVELAQACDGTQGGEAGDQGVTGLAEILADGFGEDSFEWVVAGASTAPEARARRR